MDIYKRDIVNFLFVISFPIYGVGTYVSTITSPSAGYIISIIPHLAILLFYCIDMLYHGEFKIRLNKYYFLMLIFILSSIASIFISLFKGLPETNLTQVITKSFLFIVPFHSFLVVVLYNETKGNLLRLTTISLSLLLFINMIGYFGLGLTNGTHAIEGRLNFPFLDGFYSGAALIAVINLLLFFYLKRYWKNPIRLLPLLAYFGLNFVMLLMINSRLTILAFVLVLGLCVFNIVRMKWIFTFSMFTIPILLSSGLLIYKFLSLPGLSFLLQRVDIEDVTTFNGRAFLWQDAVDWALYDQQGLLLGNGFKGHYFTGMISDVAKLWNEENLHHMHLHSSSLEILVGQGLIFFLLFVTILYYAYSYFREKHKAGTHLGAFFPVIVFLLFILQVDTFVYMENLGFVIFSLLASKVAITDLAGATQRIDQRNHYESSNSVSVPHE